MVCSGDVLESLKGDGVRVIALETVADSQCVYDFSFAHKVRYFICESIISETKKMLFVQCAMSTRSVPPSKDGNGADVYHSAGVRAPAALGFRF